MTTTLPTWLGRVSRPTLVLDVDRARRNIERMAVKAKAAGVRLRPHFKTHQSATIGGWFREHGATGITVSSVDMARYFAEEGWRDITLAFPVNLRQLDEINDLVRRIDLGLVVDDEETASVLGARLVEPARIWIKVDTGYGRAGIDWSRSKRIARLAAAIDGSGAGSFAGLLAHAGHSYHARGRREILAIHDQTRSRLIELRNWLLAAGVRRCELSIGDTPCCSVADSFEGIDEIRPGNYVFFDLTQLQLGSCEAEDLAVAVACPVVGVYPERNQLVLYGGAIHLSKDSVLDHGTRLFGYLAQRTDNGWGAPDPRLPVSSLSQEHGVVSLEGADADDIQVGDVVLVLPVHSCLTVDLYDEYLTVDGLIRRR
ncbi:MAG: alanine racemase [bacterium]